MSRRKNTDTQQRARRIQWTHRKPVLEPLKNRTLLAVDGFAPIDGVGNNIDNPEWGTPGEQLIRIAPSAYEDGLSEPARADQTNPREISNVLSVSDKMRSARAPTRLY
jgi:hypothetical protein